MLVRLCLTHLLRPPGCRETGQKVPSARLASSIDLRYPYAAPAFWPIAITICVPGYFFLEGFDFGVETRLPVEAQTRMRRTLLSTIGPIWIDNQVWLIVAAGATFALVPLRCA